MGAELHVHAVQADDLAEQSESKALLQFVY
jgi:hypothetical protein